MVPTIPQAVDHQEIIMVQNSGAKKRHCKKEHITYVFLFAAECLRAQRVKLGWPPGRAVPPTTPSENY